MGTFKAIRRGVVVMACVGAMVLGLATAASAGETSVHPRNSCGGFNGNVKWTENPITQAGTIHIWGVFWNNHCSLRYVYLFVSYTLVPNGPYEIFPIKTVGYSRTGNVGVNWFNSKSNQNFSGIKVRVCDDQYGMGCGTPIGV